MDVEACTKPKLMDDMDEDDEPLVFKRSSSSSKQNQSNLQLQKSSSSQKLDRQLGRLMPNGRSQNGQSSGVQKGKMVSSSKASPVKSPLRSPEATKSSAKASSLRSPEANLPHPQVGQALPINSMLQ
ncbi:unnamed protein product [Fraxinus pennsylvanica]|uniref:Uncharacterized protein n=1 Tax=Fraxinus pennsylvanica TaxID=56036 RepID=A0AAD1ZZB5_9LAMI|nr:unnamed protein product [Fraxinus pennsylvanica]